MAKKKHKEKAAQEKINLLAGYDDYMNQTYDDIISEIQDMQIIIQREDKRIQKRARKAAKKGDGGYFNITAEKRKVRQRVIGRMENNNFLSRIIEILKELAPIITIIARLICALILSILSIDEVKVNINKDTLRKINTVYSKAMAVM